MKLLRIGWPGVVKLCKKLAMKVRKYNPQILVGISRGGLVPVRLLSDMLNNHNVAVMKIEFYKTIGVTSGFPKITQPLTADVKGKRILIVDDVADTGRSLLVAKEHIKRAGAAEIRIATLHYKPTSVFRPDYFIVETDRWIVYPWEINETSRALKKKSLR